MWEESISPSSVSCPCPTLLFFDWCKDFSGRELSCSPGVVLVLAVSAHPQQLIILFCVVASVQTSPYTLLAQPYLKKKYILQGDEIFRDDNLVGLN